VFTTPSGSTQGGNPVNAKAVITTSSNQVTIDLSNLLTADQMVSVVQDLSDISFTLSGSFTSGLVSDTNRTYSGRLIDIASDGTVTADSGNGDPFSYNRWFFSNNGSTFTLEDLGSGQPSQTIIGGTAGSNTAYPTSGDGSITGNGPHNPFLQGVAHFTLNIEGVMAGTIANDVVFSFGTTPCSLMPSSCIDGGGGIQSTPEPARVFLTGLGLLGLGIFGRRRRQPR
jgi:hypothetical protein